MERVGLERVLVFGLIFGLLVVLDDGGKLVRGRREEPARDLVERGRGRIAHREDPVPYAGSIGHSVNEAWSAS